MPTEKQKESSRRWNRGNSSAIERHRQQKAQRPTSSWWTAGAAADAPRAAFTDGLKRRQAERLASGSDFARSPARPI